MIVNPDVDVYFVIAKKTRKRPKNAKIATYWKPKRIRNIKM